MIARDVPSSDQWTVAKLLAWTESHFTKLGLRSPRFDAELLLAHALGCSRLELYTGFQQMVEPQERASYRGYVERRSRNEPVAQIIGRREFYSLDFEVTPAVLVPRPETEHLVEVALDAFGGETPRTGRLLDLGAGSGNVAVAILANAPQVPADLVDISAAALEVARRNARSHGVESRTRFLEGDLYQPVPETAKGTYDAIVSNPPYVSAREYDELEVDVRGYEPRVALLDEKSPTGDGLGYYRELARLSSPWLRSSGRLAVEVGDTQSAAVQHIFSLAGWRVEEVVRDYGAIERTLVFTWDGAG